MASQFAQYENVVPILAPQDIAGTPTATPWLDLKTAHNASFIAYFGALTTTTASDNIAVTMEASTAASSGSEAAVAFNYRLSGATGANSWGAITAATTAGVTIASTDDNKALLVNVDPSAIAAALADATHVRLVLTPTGMAATLVAAMAFVEPRYKMTSMISTT